MQVERTLVITYAFRLLKLLFHIMVKKIIKNETQRNFECRDQNVRYISVLFI